MNTADKICKSSKLTIDYINDVTESNLFRTTQELGLSEDQTRRLLLVARQSIDDGYQKSFESFRKAVDSAVAGK